MSRTKAIPCPFVGDDCFRDDCSKIVCQNERAHNHKIRKIAEEKSIDLLAEEGGRRSAAILDEKRPRLEARLLEGHGLPDILYQRD